MEAHYIASISGGKDSAAMALHLIEQDIDFTSIFFDTGWENPLVYEYLRGELTDKIGPIIELQPPMPKLTERQEEMSKKYEDRLGHTSGMIRWTIKKGMFPSRLRRFCTQQLKIAALKKYIKTVDMGVNCVGIRAAESAARAKMPERELSTSLDCMVWRPLINWSKQDVIDIHHRHNLLPNPLYLMGAERVGCWPCIFSRKSEVRFIAETDPDRIDIIRDLEKDIETLASERYAAKGETFESLGYRSPAFFQGTPKMPMPDIDRVIEWSKTTHGGEQGAMFRDDELLPGCVSWGLCDTGTSDG
jgi:3'-phosphoadenosine 5'-phosphosulfate sulfotransferase (PAPS reductase)/FAD synthetase